MIQAVGKKVPVLTGLLEAARELDLHYIPARSPDGLPSGYPHQFYGQETAEKAVSAAERLLTVIADHYRAAGEMDILAKPDGGDSET